MSSSKYIVYKCSVCSRETELLLDGRRPDPSRCNITLSCRGKLERVGERGAREFLFTPIVPGLQDYIPRGTKITPAPALTVPNPITIFTADGDGIIALSSIQSVLVGSNREFFVIDEDGNEFTAEILSSSYTLPQGVSIRALLFEISPELLTASKYTYVITGAVQLVNGTSDDGRNLRFNSTNKIAVYVNGVELDPSASDHSPFDHRR